MNRFGKIVASTIDYVGKLLCPPHCICCDEQFKINDDRVFCQKCYEEILARIADSTSKGTSEIISGSYSLLPYNCWYSRKIIAHAKYVSSKVFLLEIGNFAYQSMANHNLIPLIDVITFTPRRPNQVRYYGFDQSEELAVAISTATGIPCKTLLKRVGFARAQKKLKGKDRAKNVKGKFIGTENIDNKNILLIDDVVTTGSTIAECARILKENGANKIYTWTLSSKV